MYEPMKQNCHDCGAEPGECHEPGCDVEICSSCGGQRLGCGCSDHDSEISKWTGFMPGVLECVAREMYARERNYPGVGGGWIKCGHDDPGARPDLNSYSVLAPKNELPLITHGGLSRVRAILGIGFEKPDIERITLLFMDT